MSERLTIEELIASEGKFVSTTSGVSMEPLFSDRRDTIIILPPKGRLKKYDVPLYRRGDDYVLHRVIKVLPDSYVIRGDNCENNEYGITDADIIGVLYAFYRKNKYAEVTDFRYRMYSFCIVSAFPVKKFFRRVHAKLRRIFKKK